MKCVHCSTRVDRRDWFCPNCKRSVPRSRPVRPYLLAGGGVALLAGAIAAGVVMLRPGGSPRVAAPEPEAALVRVSSRPVIEKPATPVEPVPAAETAPVPERDQVSREALPAPQELLPQPAPPPAAPGGNGAVTVLTVPPVKTYVYLNGGSLLGEAPLRNASIPCGKQKLLLWAPSIGGRATRTVEVEPGGSVLVIENMRQKGDFAEPGAS